MCAEMTTAGVSIHILYMYMKWYYGNTVIQITEGDLCKETKKSQLCNSSSRLI